MLTFPTKRKEFQPYQFIMFNRKKFKCTNVSKILRKVTSDMIDYTKSLSSRSYEKSRLLSWKKYLWMNHTTNSRILNLIRKESRCYKSRNKFKFTMAYRWKVICSTMVTRMFSLILSFRARYSHALQWTTPVRWRTILHPSVRRDATSRASSQTFP